MITNKKKKLNPGLDYEEIDMKEYEEYNDTLKDDDLSLDDTYEDFNTNSISNEAQVVSIWLDTDAYLNRIFLSITNKEMVQKKVRDDNNNLVTKKFIRQIPGTHPLANKIGVSQVMGTIKSIISKDLVQGNFPSKNDYNDFMYYFTIKIKRMLIINRLKWGIKLEDVDNIYNIIVDPTSLYLTRLIGNLERDRDKNRPKENPSPKESFWEKVGIGRRKNKGMY